MHQSASSTWLNSLRDGCCREKAAHLWRNPNLVCQQGPAGGSDNMVSYSFPC